MNRREFLFRCLVGVGAIGSAGRWLDESLLARAQGSSVTQREYYRVVVLGDPHLPVREREVRTPEKRQKIIKAKNNVIEDINGWDDVAEIAVVGDIAAQFGNDLEYGYAKQYFSNFTKPASLILGNHDYVYEDGFSATGRLIHGSAEDRAKKLNNFKDIFGMNSVFYSHQIGQYRLIYLSPDEVNTKYLTQISREQLAWLTKELQQHRQSPTILFFHAPLKDTLPHYNKDANTPDFIAQPVAEIEQMIQDNPQIRLWVSGHTHTPPTNENYASMKINTYANRVVNIHNTDMDREIIWSNSLYLYQDKIVIRTFNHATKQWEEKFDRHIPLT